MEVNKPGGGKLLKVQTHIIFWFFFNCYELAVSYTFNGHFSPWLSYLTFFTLNISLFYVHATMVVKYASLGRPRYLIIVLCSIAEIIGYYIIKFTVVSILMKLKLFNASSLSSVLNFFRDSTWRAVYFIGLGTAYAFGRITLASAAKINELDRQRLQSQVDQQVLEKELLTSQLAYLKAQINQHFLFNMLSFIHSNVLKYSDEIADLVIMLSDLIRYSFSLPAADGKVELDAEIEHIENYIALNQARFRHELNFDFQVSGDVDKARIISLLLISIIENVFKYADLQNKEHPARIYITVIDNKLQLRVHNLKLKKPRVHSSGIGMANVKKRLDLMYPDNYQLTVADDELFYQLELNINIPYDDLLHY